MRAITDPADYPAAARATITVHPPSTTRPVGFVWPEAKGKTKKKKGKRR